MSICLFCGQPVSLLARLRGEDRFCCPKHRDLFREESDRLALRALQRQAESALRRRSPAPSPAPETLNDPPSCGFALAGMAPQNVRRKLVQDESAEPAFPSRQPDFQALRAAASANRPLPGGRPQPLPAPAPARCRTAFLNAARKWMALHLQPRLPAEPRELTAAAMRFFSNLLPLEIGWRQIAANLISRPQPVRWPFRPPASFPRHGRVQCLIAAGAQVLLPLPVTPVFGGLAFGRACSVQPVPLVSAPCLVGGARRPEPQPVLGGVQPLAGAMPVKPVNTAPTWEAPEILPGPAPAPVPPSGPVSVREKIHATCGLLALSATPGNCSLRLLLSALAEPAAAAPAPVCPSRDPGRDVKAVLTLHPAVPVPIGDPTALEPAAFTSVHPEPLALPVRPVCPPQDSGSTRSRVSPLLRPASLAPLSGSGAAPASAVPVPAIEERPAPAVVTPVWTPGGRNPEPGPVVLTWAGVVALPAFDGPPSYTVAVPLPERLDSSRPRLPVSPLRTSRRLSSPAPAGRGTTDGVPVRRKAPGLCPLPPSIPGNDALSGNLTERPDCPAGAVPCPAVCRPGAAAGIAVVREGPSAAPLERRAPKRMFAGVYVPQLRGLPMRPRMSFGPPPAVPEAVESRVNGTPARTSTGVRGENQRLNVRSA